MYSNAIKTLSSRAALSLALAAGLTLAAGPVMAKTVKVTMHAK
jgi:hypothetical protein